MKKLYLILLMVLGIVSGAVANASDYKTMIRYDRVWESASCGYSNSVVNYMKFDGECQFFGKTFHRIVTFKQTKVEHWGTIKDDEYEFLDDVYVHEGFLREEEGKVYTIAVGGYYTEQDGSERFHGRLMTSDTPDPEIYPELNDESYDIHEVLVYDFNCNIGDSFKSYSAMFGNFEEVNVERKSIVSIDGEDCINLGIDIMGIDIIEGIGPTNHGCLNYIAYAMVTGHELSHNYFNRLYDETGHLLYEGPQVYRYILPDNLFSSVGVVTDSGELSITADGVAFGYDNRRNKVCIYDMEGRLVVSESAAGRMTVATSHLTPGMYIAEGQAEGCAASRRKFIVR